MPRFFGIRWRLAAAFFAITLTLITLGGLYLLDWTQDYYLQAISDDLQNESKLVGKLVQVAPPQDIPEVIRQMGHDLGHRITVISVDGTVIADSETDYRKMANHSSRPEVRQALETGFGTITRYSSTLRTGMLYIATRYPGEGGPAGVARVAEPLYGLSKLLNTIRGTFITTAILAILFAAIASIRLAASITRPIEEIAGVSKRLARGDLSARAEAPEKPTEEIGSLALTFNSMAERLQIMINELQEQKARMQTVFDHTDDGLILIGLQSKIQIINPAGCSMLGINTDDAVGKTVIEGTLSHDLASLVDRVSRTGEPAALDITMPLVAADQQVLHAYVAPLDGGKGDTVALVVLHDVSEAKKLDAIRRDFVANVSHELRTPLASIKAMAETILLRHKSDPSAAPQFAENIVSEADRMALLADDLLDLARIESGRRTLRPEKFSLLDVVNDVIERLRPAADHKSIEISVLIQKKELIHTDRDFLDQVLVNLVDNAIKYSPEGSLVTIGSERIEGMISVSVSDQGIGIPDEDLPRIFERFYRVDRARSRESGGTGLGLSIVKHLTEAMGGRVSVVSEVGKGTKFTVTLPAG